MRKHLLVLLALLLANAACKERMQSDLSIYKGQETDDFPYVQQLKIFTKERQGSCSTEFVSSTTALTASHCTENVDYVETMGARPRYIDHPEKDISLLYFDKPVYQDDRLPRLTKNVFAPGSTVFFVGYGNSERAKAACWIKLEEVSEDKYVCNLHMGDEVFPVAARPCEYATGLKFLREKNYSDKDLVNKCPRQDDPEQFYIYDDRIVEYGYGQRRQGRGTISHINGFGGYTYKSDDVNTLEVPMHGDSGGAWIVREGSLDFLVQIHTMGWHTIHSGTAVAEADVWPWLVELARYQAIDIPDLEPTADKVIAGAPSDCKCSVYQDASNKRWFCGWQCGGKVAGTNRFGPFANQSINGLNCEQSLCSRLPKPKDAVAFTPSAPAQPNAPAQPSNPPPSGTLQPCGCSQAKDGSCALVRKDGSRIELNQKLASCAQLCFDRAKANGCIY